MSQEAGCIFYIIFSLKPLFQKSRIRPKMIKVYSIFTISIFVQKNFAEKTQYEIDMEHLCDISTQKNFLDILNRGSALTELRKLLTAKETQKQTPEKQELDINIHAVAKTAGISFHWLMLNFGCKYNCRNISVY